jgi:hypothetical protein
MGEAKVTPPHEIAEARRKCWGTNCNRTARLEWCGWRYCLPHYWTYVLRDAGSCQYKVVKLRHTELAAFQYSQDAGRSDDRAI